MVDEGDEELSIKHNNFSSDRDFFSKIQNFIDNNIRVLKNVSWIIGAIGITIIIRRTYALHHFTNQSKIPKVYFKNNITLSGKVLKVDNGCTLGIQHIPLLWSSRLKWISEPSSTLLSVNITGIELRKGGPDYLALLLKDSNIKFQLLGKDNCKNIESILYQKKGWFRHICINEDVIQSGFAVATHVAALSHVKAYNRLIERLVKAEMKAIKKKTGIWKEESDSQHGVIYRTWYWFKSKLFIT